MQTNYLSFFACLLFVKASGRLAWAARRLSILPSFLSVLFPVSISHPLISMSCVTCSVCIYEGRIFLSGRWAGLTGRVLRRKVLSRCIHLLERTHRCNKFHRVVLAEFSILHLIDWWITVFPRFPLITFTHRLLTLSPLRKFKDDCEGFLKSIKIPQPWKQSKVVAGLGSQTKVRREPQESRGVQVVEVVDLIEVIDGAVVHISTYLCPDGSQFLVSLRLSKHSSFVVGLKLLFVSKNVC